MDYFTKKIVFRKFGYPDLEFEGDKRILPTCVISKIEAKSLLLKGFQSYLAHVIDKSSGWGVTFRPKYKILINYIYSFKLSFKYEIDDEVQYIKQSNIKCKLFSSKQKLK